jgi:hypothetical protein
MIADYIDYFASILGEALVYIFIPLIAIMLIGPIRRRAWLAGPFAALAAATIAWNIGAPLKPTPLDAFILTGVSAALAGLVATVVSVTQGDF